MTVSVVLCGLVSNTQIMIFFCYLSKPKQQGSRYLFILFIEIAQHVLNFLSDINISDTRACESLKSEDWF